LKQLKEGLILQRYSGKDFTGEADIWEYIYLKNPVTAIY